MQTTKVVSALLKAERIFLRRSMPADTGLFIDDGPVHVVAAGDADAAGRALALALAASNRVLKHPSRDGWKAVQEPMLRAVGARSWGTMAKGARFVLVEAEHGVVGMLPYAHYANKGGEGLPARRVTVGEGDPDLGAALLRALEASEA